MPRLIASGKSKDEIAALLFLSEATVKTHVSHIYAKTSSLERAQAVSYPTTKARPNRSSEVNRARSSRWPGKRTDIGSLKHGPASWRRARAHNDGPQMEMWRPSRAHSRRSRAASRRTTTATIINTFNSSRQAEAEHPPGNYCRHDHSRSQQFRAAPHSWLNPAIPRRVHRPAISDAPLSLRLNLRVPVRRPS